MDKARQKKSFKKILLLILIIALFGGCFFVRNIENIRAMVTNTIQYTADSGSTYNGMARAACRAPSSYTYTTGTDDMTGRTYSDGIRYKNCIDCGARMETQYKVVIEKGTGITQVAVEGSTTGGYYAQGSYLSYTSTVATGYTFYQWSDGDTRQNWKSGNDLHCPRYYKAYATPNTYTVAYNANGGSGTTANSSHTYDTAKNLTANGFSRTGYSFNGWNTKADGTGTSYANQASVKNLTSTNNGTVTLYAQWKANTYTVTYRANGGTGSTANNTATYGQNFLTTKNGYTRPGYKFIGWARTPEGPVNGWGLTSAGVYESGTSWKWTLTENLTLYAQWEPVESTVTYNANGGTGAPANQTVAIGSNSIVSGISPSRPGYTFKYWTTTTADIMAKIIEVNNTYVDRAWIDSYWENGIFYCEVLVNAPSGYHIRIPTWSSEDGQDDLVWHQMSEGIWYRDGQSFNYGTRFSVDQRKYDVGDTITHVYIYTNASQSNSNSLYNFALETYGHILHPGDAYPAGNTVTQTLYAQWEKNDYTIDYDVDGGLLETENPVSYNVSTDTFTLNSPTKTGYTLDWTEKISTSNWHSGFVAHATGELQNYEPAYPDSVYSEAIYLKGGVTYTLSGTDLGDRRWRYYDINGTYIDNGTELTFTPTVDGYVRILLFEGCSEENRNAAVISSSQGPSVDITKGSTGDRRYEAVWLSNVYTITLDNQGATSSGTPAYYEKYNTGIYTTSACTITMSSINVPKKTGYTFKGYYTEKNGGGEQYIDASGSVMHTNTVFTENITLYAHWTVNNYSIKYDANEGSGRMENTAATYDTSVTLRDNTFTRTGYTFKGWSTTANGSATYNNKASVLNLTAEADKTVTLYAVWEPNVYKITLDNQSATTAGTTAYYEKYNTGNYSASDCTTKISAITKPARTGYTFRGYYTGKNGAGTQYIDAAGKITATHTAFTQNTTLYAHWTINNYSIKYDANEGSGTMENTAATYGTSVTLRDNTFRRTGYTFKGWSTTANGSVAYNNKASVLNLTAEADKTVTLYAVWEPNVYKITLDNQSATTAGTTAYYEKYNTGNYTTSNCTTKISTITKPARTGYTFRGYYTGKNGTGTCYINESGSITAAYTAFAQNTTLYAHWTINTYTIKYNTNGGSGSMTNTSATYGTDVSLRQNSFSKKGYSFKGWATSANGSVVYKDKETVKNLTAEHEATVNLYAVWEINSYKVSYNGNGGTTSVSSKMYNYGSAIDLSVTAQKSGYRFVGWSLSKTAILPLKSYYVPDENITLYAVYTISVSDVENHEYPLYTETADIAHDEVYLLVWIEGNPSINKYYPLTYIEDTNAMVYRYELPQTDISSFVNGRSFCYQVIAYDNAGNSTILKTGGSSSGSLVPPPRPVKYMQTVKHYKYNENTSEWEWFDTTGEKVLEGTTYTPAFIEPPTGFYASHKDGGSVVTGEKTYNAYYKPNTYTIKYNANGGSGSMADTAATYDKAVSLSKNAFTFANHTFIGWSTSQTGSVVYLDEATAKNLTSENGKTITLYAQWKENVYTITLNSGGAETTGTTVYYEKYNIGNYTTFSCTTQISTITKPAQTGYTFKGYYTETDGKGTQYIDASGKILSTKTSFAADTTLYAYWVANTYNIKYHANGGSGTMEDTIAIYDESVSLRTNAFTLIGYTFDGWSTTETGVAAYPDKATIRNLTSENGKIIDLYAVWKPVVYKITLDNQSATTAGTTAYYEKYSKGNYTTKDCATSISTITKPAKTGYTFKGYYTGKDGTGTQYINATGKILSAKTTFTADTTLYAYWVTNTYTIKYNANGGSGSMANTSATYDKDAVLRSNAFTLIGYTFDGWSTTETGNVVYTDMATVKNLTSENGKTINLFAVWKENVYMIKLDADEADTVGTTVYYQKYNKGNYTTEDCATTISTITKPTKTGYTFNGYYTGKDGTGTQYIDASGKILSTKTTFTDDITLYASWTANTYTIKYHANGGSGSMADTTATYGEFVTLRTNSFAKVGHEFAGWATSENGAVVYENGSMQKNLTTVKGETITLYAVWTPVVYKITLDSQDANDVGTAAYYEKYSKGNYTTENCTATITTITKPAKTGYTFMGYYTGKNGTGTQYIDASGKILSTKTTFTDHITLYASWTANTYTIKYNANGGSGTMNDTPATYDKPVTLETNLFYKTGYTFKGWALSSEGEIVYSDRSEVKNLSAASGGFVTLYAVWEINPYTVTYDYITNGGKQASSDILSFDYGTKIDLTVTAEKENYTFVGWNTDSSATTGLTSLTMGTEPITVYAIFKKDITVTFVEYGNSGTVTTTQTKTVYNNVTNTEFLVKENTTWDEWTNVGWTTETGAMADSAIVTGANYTADSNVTLYARYHSEVQLSYDTNGSTVTIDSVKKDRFYNASGERENPKYTVANEPIYEDHSFVNWKMESGNIQDEYGYSTTITSPREDIIVLENTVLKAVWDKYPVIEAYNRHFTVDEAKSGKITEEELLERVIATDDEAKSASNPDGVLERGVDVIVKNYNTSDFTGVTGDKEIFVTYQATDSFGNVVTKTVTVTITDTTMQKSPMKTYARFISTDFLVDDTGALLDADEGGLEETSIWRTNEAYNDLLIETLSNTKTNVEKKKVSALGQTWEVEIAGSGEWTKKEDTWIFTRNDIQEMKTYTRTYGYILNAVERFFELFEGCKQ